MGSTRCWIDSSATSSVTWMRPSLSGGVDRAASSSPLSALRIPARHAGQMLVGRLVHPYVQVAQAPILVGHGAPEQLDDVLGGQVLKLKQAAAADQRRGHGDHGVLGGRADKADGALLHRGENRVGLGLVPPVALVQEQVGAPAVELEAVLGRGDDLPHLPSRRW